MYYINIGVVTPIIDLENMSIIHYRSMLFNSWMEKKHVEEKYHFKKTKKRKVTKVIGGFEKIKQGFAFFQAKARIKDMNAQVFHVKKRSCAAQQPMQQVNPTVPNTIRVQY